jgi:hypothetical protein
MSEDGYDFAAEPQTPPKQVSDIAKREQAVIEAPPVAPNSVLIKLWGGGHISFAPDSSATMFAIIALILLLIAILLFSCIGLFVQPTATWADKLSGSLGNGISAIVGAIFGASATGSARKRK